MTLKGKIALIIVLPTYVGFITLGFLIAVVIYFFALLLSFTGIGEAFEYLGKKIRSEAIRSKFRDLRRKEGLK
jgi:CHASE3 domain sensor protein